MMRLHGKPPYKTILIHGGPGAVGSLEICADRLSRLSGKGVAEALQSKYSIAELKKELYEQIRENCAKKVTLIGHSWGAWLAALFIHAGCRTFPKQKERFSGGWLRTGLPMRIWKKYRRF